MPIEMQPKLLRVLEDGVVTRLGGVQGRQVQVRIIAASNVDFPARIAEGKFREDLFYRLARFTVKAPPLREHKEDLFLLADHFLRLFASEMSLPAPPVSQDAKEALMGYPFPGNVRELKNIIERALVESGGAMIQRDHLHFFYLHQTATAPAEDTLDAPADTDSTPTAAADEERIMQHVRAQGSITNSDCRELLGVERNRASYLLKKLHGSGFLRCEGQGRWATYRLP